MIREYATPLAFKTAVEQRLRNEIAHTGMDLHRRRQLLIFDRFLARVFEVFESGAVLKGGLVLELRLERARTTKDVDLRLTGKPEDILIKLREAGNMDLGDYLSFRLQPDPRHPVIRAEGLPYEGLRYRAEARLAGRAYGAPFGIDVALAEPLFGSPEVVEGSRFLSFAGVAPNHFRIYSVEAHVAEKLHAYSLPRKRPSSRVRDLPDLALLASVGPMEANRLQAAIEFTFQHRATHPVPAVMPTPPQAWIPVYARLAEADGLVWKTLDRLEVAVGHFLNPILAGDTGYWDPGGWTWRSMTP